MALWRRNSALHDYPVLEVVCVSAITAAISYLVCHVFTSEGELADLRCRLSFYGMNFASVSLKDVQYAMRFIRDSVQTSELVANLFQECDPIKGDYHGLCK